MSLTIYRDAFANALATATGPYVNAFGAQHRQADRLSPHSPTAIGHALANLYRFQGWRVEGINCLGDWGKQFGLVAWGSANSETPLEPTTSRIWSRSTSRPTREPKKTLPSTSALETSFGEWSSTTPVIEEIARAIGTTLSDGALIIDLPYAENDPPVLLKKNDGSTLYATRDLAAAVDRHRRFAFDRALYVVAADQSLHFRQVFGVREKLGKPWAKGGDASLLVLPEEQALVREIARFPLIIAEAVEANEPSFASRSLLQLAAFSPLVGHRSAGAHEALCQASAFTTRSTSFTDTEQSATRTAPFCGTTKTPCSFMRFARPNASSENTVTKKPPS